MYMLQKARRNSYN